LAALEALAPEGHTVRASTSTLAKLLTWHAAGAMRPGALLAHQADWIAAQLHGQHGVRGQQPPLRTLFFGSASPLQLPTPPAPHPRPLPRR
jgi:hypothetical protein